KMYLVSVCLQPRFRLRILTQRMGTAHRECVDLLNCHPEWPGNHVALDKFVGTLALEQSIVSNCNRNALLHFLNFVRLHSAAELLNQSPAPVPELLRAGFRKP